MNRNQKIALGCGGGGCLIVILAVVAIGALIATGVIKAPGITSYTDTNDNSNENSNSNSNFNSSANRNSNSNSASNSNRSSSSSSMSEDDKHKLFQAAAASQDADLVRRVSEKLGLLKPDGSPTDEYAPFFKEHLRWIFRNTDFMQTTISTPEKAREYVNEHIDD
ncbi:MAG TPA: hypothetical protein VJU86_10960 [Pyrinomonadaceae bacterium]|nr:hypothetical protein [Pyrinomonadaceae bacterium]